MSAAHRPEIRAPALDAGGLESVRWGRGVVIGPRCRRIRIGRGAFIGNDVYIDVDELTVGDYFTLHQGSVIHGQRASFGHNCWIGQYSILDALGGALRVGNNVGVGAHSQLWSHMKFGDRLAGCRWYQARDLVIDDDVWFVGHCIVTPIHAARRSMLFVGGVATRDMEENHVYAGSPAHDVTDRVGPQFAEVDPARARDTFRGYVAEYAAQGHAVDFIRTCTAWPGAPDDRTTWFDLERREYLPRYTPEEMAFMRFLLYDRAKFLPVKHPGAAT